MWFWLISAARGWDVLAIIIRLTVALVVGLVIGIDRGLKHRGAGIKTHALVCLGSALVMLTSEYIAIQFPEVRADMNRMGAQVISGVGFLGVGTIIVTGRHQVRGLTTAAGLWTCACLGLAAGIGFIDGAIYALVFVVFIFKVFNRLDIYVREHAVVYDFYIEFVTGSSVARFIDAMRSRGVKISSIELTKSRIKGEGPSAIITLEIRDRRVRETILGEIQSLEFVRYAEET
ncbi:MgtC/SapB family protein [Clostridium vitabionis]|uniref:MgtC/SapB family protein n=1 Tax=Clostridium vitabionis TaxID=2784388 RepID=UPI00188C2916|nr:MgtC/SapB family protein [Clostridium vitabionis]